MTEKTDIDNKQFNWKEILNELRTSISSIQHNQEEITTVNWGSTICSHFPRVISSLRVLIIELDEIAAADKAELQVPTSENAIYARNALRYVQICIQTLISSISENKPPSNGYEDHVTSYDSTTSSYSHMTIHALQTILVQKYKLHLYLSRIISHTECTYAQIRTISCKILCNLITMNLDTSQQVFADIPLSPSSTTTEKKVSQLLSSMNLSSQIGSNDDNTDEDICIASTKNVSSWTDMIFTSGGHFQDRESLAAIVATLYNILCTFENNDFATIKLPTDNMDSTISKPSLLHEVANNLSKNEIFMCNIIRHILPLSIVKHSDYPQPTQQCETRDITKNGEDKDNYHDDAFLWTSLFIRKLSYLGCLPTMYNSLGSVTTTPKSLSTTATNSTFSHKRDTNNEDSDIIATNVNIYPEQLVLLNCIAQALDEYSIYITKTTSSSVGAHATIPNSQSFPLGGYQHSSNNYKHHSSVLVNVKFLATLWCQYQVTLHELHCDDFDDDNNTTNDVNKNSNNDQDANQFDARHYDGVHECMKSASILILEILSSFWGMDLNRKDLTKCHNDDVSSHQQSISPINKGLLDQARYLIGTETHFICSLLQTLGSIIDSICLKTNRIVSPSDSTTNTTSSLKNRKELKISNDDQILLTNLVRIIGNICYQCKYNQDLVRATKVPLLKSQGTPSTIIPDNTSFSDVDKIRNGLHVLLTCTSISYGCLTLREWTIVAIRNLLENNDENRRIVDELEAQSTVQTGELDNLGLQVQLKNGKVCITPNS